MRTSEISLTHLRFTDPYRNFDIYILNLEIESELEGETIVRPTHTGAAHPRDDPSGVEVDERVATSGSSQTLGLDRATDGPARNFGQFRVLEGRRKGELRVHILYTPPYKSLIFRADQANPS